MATIKDIANQAKVSPATVSRVLNYDASLSISEAKRKKVFEVAERLDYATPRQRAERKTQAKRKFKLAMLHFLSPSKELDDPFYIAIRMGIETRAQEMGVQVTKIYAEDDVEHKEKLLSGVDAILAVGRFPLHEARWMKAQCSNIVFVDSTPKEEEFDAVVLDLERAVRATLDEVCALGYRNIGFFGGAEILPEFDTPLGEVRRKAFVEYAQAHDLNVDGHIYIEAFAPQDGYNMAKQMLAKPTRPDLILCGSDAIAAGAMRALHEAGVKIPQEIALVGIDDIPSAQHLHPSLTTVRLNAEMMGETAVDLIKEQLAGRSIPKKVVIPTSMVWRESCPKPAN